MPRAAFQLRLLTLMANALDQLRHWFERAILDNHRLYFSIARQILRNPADAEDAVQTAACKAWTRLSELTDRDAIVGWVATIVRRTAIDLYRSRREQTTDDATLRLLAPAIHDPPRAQQADDRAAMQALIARLPDAQATVLTLRFYEGLDAPAIARRLGLTDNAVRVRIHRALERLAQFLEPQPEDSNP